MAGGEAMGQEQLDLYTDYLLSVLNKVQHRGAQSGRQRFNERWWPDDLLLPETVGSGRVSQVVEVECLDGKITHA
jgi:hypothetical protein